MMLANSVAMFTIACSLFQLGFGGVPHSVIPSENTVTSLPPIEMMNTTISTIATIIPDESSKIQTVESSTALLEKIRDIMRLKKAVNVSNDNSQVKQYFQLLKKNIELDLHTKFETLQSRVLELENDQNHQRNIMKEKDILISELSLGTLELSAKLYQSQEKLLNITEQYIKLEKSYLTAQKKIETHNDELDNEKKKHSVEILNLNTEVGQLKENNKKCTDQQGVLDKSLEIANSELVKINETLSMKSAELDDLKQKHSVESLNLSTEISQLKDKNGKCMDQQGELENSLKTAKSDLVKNNETQSQALDSKSAELDDLKQKHSVEILNLNMEVGKLKENNKKCTDQQGVLDKSLEIANSDLVKIKETLSTKTAELENLQQKNSIDLLKLNTEVVQEKDKNKKCMDQQGILEKNLETTKLDLVKNKEALSTKTAELKKLEEKSTAGSKWVKYSGVFEIVPGMVEIGADQDGSKLVIGRASHNGDILPAKVKPKRGIAYVSDNGKEYEKPDYEILFGTHFNWVHVENGHLPSDIIAVPGGKTSSGEILYVGRETSIGSSTAGKVDPKSNKLLTPYNGKEFSFNSYEVLVMH